jgi:hypothetical protein
MHEITDKHGEIERPGLTPIRECGDSRTGTLRCSWQQIVDTVGAPNCTDLDDPNKVAASWGFQDQNGRKGFIWSYKVPKSMLWTNMHWSLDGDLELLIELFGTANVKAG